MATKQKFPTWLTVPAVIIGLVLLAIFHDRIDWPQVWPFVWIALGAIFVYQVFQLFVTHVPAIAKASKETAENVRAIRELLEAQAGVRPEEPAPSMREPPAPPGFQDTGDHMIRM